jgi:hypothetical protein
MHEIFYKKQYLLEPVAVKVTMPVNDRAAGPVNHRAGGKA